MIFLLNYFNYYTYPEKPVFCRMIGDEDSTVHCRENVFRIQQSAGFFRRNANVQTDQARGLADWVREELR